MNHGGLADSLLVKFGAVGGLKVLVALLGRSPYNEELIKS